MDIENAHELLLSSELRACACARGVTGEIRRGLGFGVWGLGLRVEGLGFELWGLALEWESDGIESGLDQIGSGLDPMVIGEVGTKVHSSGDQALLRRGAFEAC